MGAQRKDKKNSSSDILVPDPSTSFFSIAQAGEVSGTKRLMQIKQHV